MDRKSSPFDVESPSYHPPSGSPRATQPADAGADPRSRRLNRSARANAFGEFSGEILRDLNPRGPLERVVAEHVASSAWRLKTVLGRQTARLDGPAPTPADPKRHAPSSADRAARSLRDALETFDGVLASREYRAKTSATFQDQETLDGGIEPNEWPIVPFQGLEEAPAEAESESRDEAPSWGERLAFDPEISTTSPVIKGTWITVNHVVSLIVDGQTWAEILRWHPELSEEDIRTCVAYSIAHEQDEV